jgi:hypothetical protein
MASAFSRYRSSHNARIPALVLRRSMGMQVPRAVSLASAIACAPSPENDATQFRDPVLPRRAAAHRLLSFE